MTLAPGHSVLGIHFSTTTSTIFFYLGVGLTRREASKLQNIPCGAWQAALKHKWSDRYETMQLNLLGVLYLPSTIRGYNSGGAAIALLGPLKLLNLWKSHTHTPLSTCSSTCLIHFALLRSLAPQN